MIERPTGHFTPWLAAMFALVVLGTTWIAWRASFPMEINFNEPWNAWLSDLAMQPDKLYPPRDALVMNNYPPLSRLIMHVFAELPIFSNALYAGRAISLVSLFASAAAVYSVSRDLGARPAPAALGALWFAALILQSGLVTKIFLALPRCIGRFTRFCVQIRRPAYSPRFS